MASKGTWNDAEQIARDLVSEVGRGRALVYLLRQVLRAEGWRSSDRGLRLLWAVLLV